MFRFFRLWLGLLAGCFRSHRTLLLENLALRQQLTVLKRRHPKPKLSPLDKLFWVAARGFWSAWKSSLIIVTPETVVRWHRAGFRRYWSLISRVKERVGRKKLSREITAMMKVPMQAAVIIEPVRAHWRSTVPASRISGRERADSS